ncbi:hypothetical protein ACFLZE_03815 [Thermodesulfobacteriota bacterium]
MKARIRMYPFFIVLVAMLTVFIVSPMAQEKPADNMQLVREKWVSLSLFKKLSGRFMRIIRKNWANFSIKPPN